MDLNRRVVDLTIRDLDDILGRIGTVPNIGKLIKDFKELKQRQ